MHSTVPPKDIAFDNLKKAARGRAYCVDLFHQIADGPEHAGRQTLLKALTAQFEKRSGDLHTSIRVLKVLCRYFIREEKRGVSLAAEINRQNATKETII